MIFTIFAEPAVTAAIVAGIVSVAVALINRRALLKTHKERLEADHKAIERRVSADLEMAVQKLAAERDRTMGDKAWADYELRRDIYTKIAHQVDCLFEKGDAKRRPEFHRSARTVRLVGSDQVVRALNDFTAGIRERRPNLEQKYRALFNAMRRDIRQLHSLPPEGTDLDEDAFPLES